MTKRRAIYVFGLVFITFVAYAVRHWLIPATALAPTDQALVARSCAGEPLDAARPLLATDAVDRRVTERYGEVCRSLALDPHLHFGIGLDVYQCRIWIPRNSASAEDRLQLQKISTLFGHRDFDLMAYPRKAGIEATVLLVTDDGEDVAAISDQKSLMAGVQQIRDLQGAAEIVALLNDTGRLSQPPSLCEMHVQSDDAGWTLTDVKVPENCAPPWWRSYRIERTGHMQLLGSSKRWWRFDNPVCSD